MKVNNQLQTPRDDLRGCVPTSSRTRIRILGAESNTLQGQDTRVSLIRGEICGRQSELNGYSQRQGSPLSKHELTLPRGHAKVNVRRKRSQETPP